MENKRIYPLTIILPTYNEEENMNIWLPEVISQLSDVSYLDFEILVVDDNSKDLTQSVVNNLILSYKNLRLITRLDEPSLSDSIFEGITAATKSNIMWLDADGSMDIESILKIISQAHEDNLESIYVGSRFIKDGGYKGKDKSIDLSINKILSNLINSEESPLAIFLSLYFNKILSKILNLGVTDLTSGFILGPKRHFQKKPFVNSHYGEYFIKVIVDLHIQGIEINEVGYYCKPRLYGKSKTSTNLFRLISLSKPYIFTAISSRKEIREHLRQRK